MGKTKLKRKEKPTYWVTNPPNVALKKKTNPPNVEENLPNLGEYYVPRARDASMVKEEEPPTRGGNRLGPGRLCVNRPSMFKNLKA